MIGLHYNFLPIFIGHHFNFLAYIFTNTCMIFIAVCVLGLQIERFHDILV